MRVQVDSDILPWGSKYIDGPTLDPTVAKKGLSWGY